MHQPIRDDLDSTVGRQQIDEDAGVLFGVPDALFTEHLQRPLAGCQPPPKRMPAQSGLQRETDLTPMSAFTGHDGGLDAIEGRIVEGTTDRIRGQAAVTPEAGQAAPPGLHGCRLARRAPVDRITSHRMPLLHRNHRRRH